MQVQIVKNITKEYPDMIRVLIYKEPKFFLRSEGGVKRNREIVGEDYEPSISSLSRTKSLVRDLVLCNDFDLFCTFTFDPAKIDRFNFSACSAKMRQWIHHQSDRSREARDEFKYLIIPERHKSGAWHFHALISGYHGNLHDSGIKTTSLRSIYNMTSFRGGFTTAVKIDSKEAVSNYVTKYITKDFVKDFNQRRFFCSRNLLRPQKTLNSPMFAKTLPIFRRKIWDSDDREEFLLLT